MNLYKLLLDFVIFFCNMKIYSDFYLCLQKMDLVEKKALYYSLDEAVTPRQLREMSEISFEEEEKEKAEILQKWMEKFQVKALFEGMTDYPEKLLQVKNTPYIVYAMGDVSLLQKKILGIVGPREMSEYAEQLLEAFFQQGKEFDLVTVSGMARGVDQKCHQLSLKYGVPTIAVLGGGLKYYFEDCRGLKRFSEDSRKIQKIIEGGGLVLSEFKLDFVPTKWSFPQRNRLIAGLSDCLFLPEAREGSGSLITVDFVLQMKKEVWVAPNQLFAFNGK